MTKTVRDIRVVVMGAGMAGILSGIKLLEAGITNCTIYEKANRVGGTWRENTYPGLTCDVPSHAYTYSLKPNPDWSHVLPPGRRDPGVLRAHGEEVRGGSADPLQPGNRQPRIPCRPLGRGRARASARR